jgi:hypothetical protein
MENNSMRSKKFSSTHIENKLNAITLFVEKIKTANSVNEKLAIVNSLSSVDKFLSRSTTLKTFLLNLKPEFEYIVKVLIMLDQGPLFFSQIDLYQNTQEDFLSLLTKLWEVEIFYSFMGGLAGYYKTVISLIVEKEKPSKKIFRDEHYYRPSGIDISTDLEAQRTAVRWAIERLPLLAHICPIGGAGDRLNLVDETTGEPLPVAFLQFGGHSLLEGIVRDLQGIEFLYWKICNKQLIIPLALMTSEEKDNDRHIKNLCEKLAYFNRKKENFRQFLQPLVPVITEDGDFALSSSLNLILKPGGHGVLWRLALENNIFGWFESLGKKKLLIRQINNPVAATDVGIWSLVGLGEQHKKVFGFLSCDRLIGASEGMLAVKETTENDKFSYCLTNIEYTDFASKGLTDTPKSEGSPYSIFPANTNILFADIATISETIYRDPVPGMIINMKSKFQHIDQNGNLKESHGGRLESMMQNIADSIVDVSSVKLNHQMLRQLHSFIVYEQRTKVISVTKNQFTPEKSINETPEGCFYDQMCNANELLSKHCSMILPSVQTPDDFMQQGPNCIVRYHPALGPLYQVISQKLRGGTITAASELLLEIAELNIENLTLNGSLQIVAKDLLGHKDQDGTICYSEQNGKCQLINVTVLNRGIDRKADNNYWKNEITRHEQLEIILHGNAEFYAADVVLKGGITFEVPHGQRLEVTMHEGKILHQKTEISTPTWQWDCKFDEHNIIKMILKKETNA